MVRIVNYKERESDDGSVFFALTLQGGVELIKSKSSGKFYATAKKTSITSTFDEETCKALLGTEIPGSIQKQSCEPYTFTIKESGEVVELDYRYEYLNSPSERRDMSEATIEDFVSNKSSLEVNHPLLTS